MKRFLLFAGIFFGVVALVYLLVFGANARVFSTVFQNRDALAEGSEWVEHTYSLAGLADFAAAQPRRVAVLMRPADAADTISIAYGHDQARPMVGLQGLIPYSRYIANTASGAWSPDERIPADSIRRFRVDGVENRRLEAALADLGDAPRLERLAAVLARSGHFWIADYLMHKAGPAVDLPAGIDAYIPYQTLYNRLPDPAARSFQQERDLYAGFPKATSAALADLMDRLAADTTAVRHLSWSMADPSIRTHFTRYLVYYDSRMSYLGGVAVGTSHYTGNTYTSVVRFTDIPAGLWFHLSANFMNQDFQQRLIWDPALYERLATSISQRP